MKIWYGYGSDHSAKLVMIGEFKTEEDAARIYELINTLLQHASSDAAEEVIDHWTKNERFSEDTEKRLRELQLYYVSPSDIADFAFADISMDKSANVLQFWTDDVDIGGFVKLLVNSGAKVQVYSAHHYQDTDKE